LTFKEWYGIVELQFKNNKIRRQCEDPKRAQKDFGPAIGNTLTQRVVELAAATSLMDIRAIPSARLHRLRGARSEEYAVDLVHPYRLVFRPVLEDGVAIHALNRINIVRIEEVTDYHGKQKRK
jgi:proteic killer suppression protein